MPRATRNTNAYSGVEGSDPGKSKTWLNTSAATPSVAANDTTLASTSSTGATTERSSSISTTRITSRIAGMITRRSRSLASLTSRLEAELPPTSTSVPTVSQLAAQPGDGVLGGRAVGGRAQGGLHQDLAVDDLRRRAGHAGPAGGHGGRRHVDVPLQRWPRPASARSSVDDDLDRAAGPGREVAGEDLLAGDRLDLVEEQLGLGDAVGPERRDEPAEHQQRQQRDHPRTAGGAGRPCRPRGPRPPGCPRRPRRARGPPAGPGARRSGGRTAAGRPGRKVSAATTAPAMPMAPTGPRPRVLPSWDSSRQSRPRMTVAALAPIGSTAARQATRIAAHLLGWSCSSSR